ncbi:MAG: threonine synthase [Bacteroidetes bacterium]|nr:threonine synthase [Bacteroidota bacterium]
MEFISTRVKENTPTASVHASAAILKGLAPDGGLYVPKTFPQLSQDILDGAMSYQDTAYHVLKPFFENDPLENDLKSVCDQAFDFPVPLHWYNNSQAVLELFHGPTAAFKDFGARFLAGAMEKLIAQDNSTLTILVATSGDTGGAVASAYYGKKDIKVKVLFPEGRVSDRQEKQLTCWGGNVEAYAVHGAFDDCQRMVKEAFMNQELSRQWNLTSANSINLGRLLPQAVYYVYTAIEYQKKTGVKPVFVIPSGNVGNSIGAHWAKAMGAPVERIVLAVNANKTIPDYLNSGRYEPRESIATLANAMDVGDPSNMERLRYLFPKIEDMRGHVTSFSVSDDQILSSIGDVWEDFHYVVCPHTAAGEFVRRNFVPEKHSIVVATAHPAKFETIVEPVVGQQIPIPEALAGILEKEGHAEVIAPIMENIFSR